MNSGSEQIINMKCGTIDISQLKTPPEKSEFETARYFAERGKNIVFIRPSSIPYQHSPDILMDGIEWEIKCPKGKSKRTIENNMRKALSQSSFVIFDLRYIRLSEKPCITQLKAQFYSRSKLNRLLIIKKNNELIELKK